MSREWQHLYRPAVVGFLVGLAVTTVLFYFVPVGLGPAPTHPVR